MGEVVKHQHLMLLHEKYFCFDFTLTYHCEGDCDPRVVLYAEHTGSIPVDEIRHWGTPTWGTVGRRLWGTQDHRLGTTAVDKWGLGVKSASAQTGTGAKYSSPLITSIRMNARANLPFSFTRVRSVVEAPQPGAEQRR